MHHPMQETGTWRLPVVMAVVHRGYKGMQPDHSDLMSQQWTGWNHWYVEHAQEILDTLLMAYKVAEDKEAQANIALAETMTSTEDTSTGEGTSTAEDVEHTSDSSEPEEIDEVVSVVNDIIGLEKEHAALFNGKPLDYVALANELMSLNKEQILERYIMALNRKVDREEGGNLPKQASSPVTDVVGSDNLGFGKVRDPWKQRTY